MKLVESFSLFLYAFKMQKNFLESNSMWKRSDLGPEKDFFFNHVQDFFTKNNIPATTEIDESCCLRYEIDKNAPSDVQKEKLFLANQLFSRASQTSSIKNSNPITFKLVSDSSILAPNILYNPITGIGILSFGFILGKESSGLEQLIELNYMSRIFGRADSAIFSIQRNEHPNAKEQEDRIASCLKKIVNNKNITENGQSHFWDIDTLTKYFLQDIPTENLQVISPNRLQGFTYLQTESKMVDQELGLASFRLRRFYNKNYIPGNKFLQNTTEINQTFEQIHFGASIEGCVVIVNEDQDKLPSFLKNYGIIVKSRYIWSYLLAYYQRLAMIEMATELGGLYDNGQPGLEKLLQVASNLSKVELRTLFNQVSYFSQHNDFYDFCKSNLKLEEMYADIKQKLSGISRIIQEKHEIEEKAKEKKREKKDRLLEVMIATLLIPEIIFEFLSTLAHVFEIKFPMVENNASGHKTESPNAFTYFLFAFSTILFLTLIPFAIRIYKEYYFIAKAYFKKTETDDDLGLKKHYIE